MFTSVISSLTTLLPKYFIFGSYVPTLIFLFVNVGLAYLFSAWLRGATQTVLTASTPITVAALFVLSVVFAYMLSSVQDYLREILEGRHAWLLPGLKDEMRAVQRGRRAKLDAHYGAVRVLRYRLAGSRGAWRDALVAAANDGAAAHPGATGYPSTPADIDAEERVSMLRVGGDAVTDPGDVQAAIDALAGALRRYDKRADTRLAAAHRELLVALDRIIDRAREAEYACATELQSYPAAAAILPTRLGNVTAALDGYAVERYGIDLTVFLSRLQAVLVQSEQKAYGIVLDAKTQLDFLVAGFWLSLLSVVFWDCALAPFGGAAWAFLIVALAGPFVPVVFYALATESALAYAEAVRTCVDLNRFALLRALDVPLPQSAREERVVWAVLSRATLLGPEGTELSYEHPAP